MSRRRLAAALVAAICGGGAAAHADAIYVYGLNGVMFNGGQTATGTFTFDATTGTVTQWNIQTTGSGPNSPPATDFSNSTGSASYTTQATYIRNYSTSAIEPIFLQFKDPSGFNLDFDLATNLALDQPATILGNDGYSGTSKCGPVYNCTPWDSVAGGALDPVPEPASVALFGLALLGLAGTQWSRRRVG